MNPQDINNFIEKGGSIVRLWERDLTQERIDSLHQAGVAVWCMTGGTGTGRDVGEIGTSGLQKIVNMDIDGILLNDPTTILEILNYFI
jgi:hypothetical protein